MIDRPTVARANGARRPMAPPPAAQIAPLGNTAPSFGIQVPEPRRHRILGFPNPVNEKAARTVAAGVFLWSSATLVASLVFGESWLWLTVPLAVGFILRALSGPRFSPLGLLATRVVAPRLGPPKLVPGPPKRFAQAIGAVLTTSAVVALALGSPLTAQVLLGLVIVASGLESVFAFCVGCRIFNVLMRLGLIPEATCEACADLSTVLR